MSGPIRIIIVGACAIALIALCVLLALRFHHGVDITPGEFQATASTTTDFIPAPTTESHDAAIVAGSPYQVTTIKDIPYATVGTTTLTMTLYQPVGVKYSTPVIVFTHPGGFQTGNADIKKIEDNFGPDLASHGYTLASVNYELAEDATMPAPIYDDFGAIRFLRANAAKYNLDSGRFATMGSSAGSVLATMVGVMADDPSLYGTVGGNLGESDAVEAIVAVSGEWYSTDLNELDTKHVYDHTSELGCTDLSDPSCVVTIEQYFAEFHLDSADPPTIIFQGSADTASPPDNATDLTNAMKAAGIDATLVMNPGEGHGEQNGLEHMSQIYSFLDGVFKK